MTTHPSSYYVWWQHILRHITCDDNTSIFILRVMTTHPSSSLINDDNKDVLSSHPSSYYLWRQQDVLLRVMTTHHDVILLVMTTHPSSYYLWRQHILLHITCDDNTSFVILTCDDNTSLVILCDDNRSFVILLVTSTQSYYVWWQHILRHITCDDNTYDE